MLVARSSTTVRGARLRHIVCLTRPISALFVERSGLVFDTRFVPGAEARATPESACLYILLDGVWDPHGGEPLVGPAAFVLTEAALEGASGTRPLTFRSFGAPYVAIELRLTSGDLTIQAAETLRVIALDTKAWSAAREAARAHDGDDAMVRRSIVELVRSLASGGVVHPSLAERVTAGSPGFERLWNIVRPTVERFYAGVSLEELSVESGISTRQLTRDVSSFFSTFSLVKTGWRAATKRMRLKLAVLFLSADEVSVSEVARTVGYGSSDAMSRAFRDAGLPAPSEVQARVRAAKESAR
jgi:AraC-like DNA-binding protein